MEMTPVIVTHILETGTSFGSTTTKPPQGVFIPASVSKACGLVVAQEVNAKLVPNTMQPERTPWLAVSVEVLPPQDFVRPVGELVSARAWEVMRNGGVWNAQTMFEELFPEHHKSAKLQEYNTISSTLCEMFARGECAKFQMWRSPDDNSPGREWFTCYPERADVDEWVDV